MAAFAFTDGYLSLNATDVSDYVKSVTLNIETNPLNSATMGDTWDEFIAGMRSGSIAVTFVDSVTNSEIDDILWAIFGTVVAFEIRPTSAAVGANNPKYTGSVLIQSHGIGGSLGDLAGKTVTYPTSGTITRAEA